MPELLIVTFFFIKTSQTQKQWCSSDIN